MKVQKLEKLVTNDALDSSQEKTLPEVLKNYCEYPHKHYTPLMPQTSKTAVGGVKGAEFGWFRSSEPTRSVYERKHYKTKNLFEAPKEVFTWLQLQSQRGLKVFFFLQQLQQCEL